jgi:hypothetical protein
MKATVYYVRLNDEQTATINNDGWASEVGKAYMEATMGGGKYKAAMDMGLYEKAAVLEATESENVFTRLQNLEHGWTEDKSIECTTNFPRSMSVGDVIVWEDGRKEIVASFGFEPVPDFIGETAPETVMMAYDAAVNAAGTPDAAAAAEALDTALEQLHGNRSREQRDRFRGS